MASVYGSLEELISDVKGRVLGRGNDFPAKAVTDFNNNMWVATVLKDNGGFGSDRYFIAYVNFDTFEFSIGCYSGGSVGGGIDVYNEIGDRYDIVGILEDLL